MKMLVAAGADPKLATTEGVTPLMVAAGLGWGWNFSVGAPGSWLAATRYCLELGLDVNTVDTKGQTALHGAAYVADNTLVQLLVDKGANIRAVAKDGNTIADMANGPNRFGIPHPETVALLEKLGSANSHNCRSDTCLVAPAAGQETGYASLTMPLNRHRRLKIAVVLMAVFSVPVAVAEVYLDKIATSHPAIHWFEGPFDNPVERLQQKLEAGTAKLEYRDEKLTYLPSLLENLGISPESQALVFSKTSFQSTKISPQNPRAVYFADDAAVGFVRGTDLIEIAATDNRQGIQFYTLTQKPSEKPRFEHRDVCIQCHQGPATSGVPGIFIGSAIPNQAGNIAPEGAIITDHRTKFEDRWGGWFITAKSGQVKDRSNSFATNPSEPDVLDSSLGQESA